MLFALHIKDYSLYRNRRMNIKEDLFMASFDSFNYIANWPIALLQDLSRGELSNFCDSKSPKCSFGKNLEDSDNVVNLSMQQMFFVADDNI